MFTNDDLKGLHGFLRQTAEGNLIKMLAGGKMTEVHVRMLLKIARAVNEEEFCVHWQAGTFPKVKFNPGEVALKETFFGVCGDACTKFGLITPTQRVA